MQIISEEGIKVDAIKSEAMQTWALPKSLKALQGFLRLIRYNDKFMKYYGNIVGPPHGATKKIRFFGP